MTPPSSHLGHDARMERARLALEGLSVGDAFGGRFIFPQAGDRTPPAPPWWYSDDTEMAMAIVEVLRLHHKAHRNELAKVFARRYLADPYRGYGQSVRRVLERIGEGVPWQVASREVFGGSGSMGNGAAMRVAPLGAYFADDYFAVVEQAKASAEVTHAHPEGQAGAIAVAVAAAWAANAYQWPSPRAGAEMLETVLAYTPSGDTRQGLELALRLGPEAAIEEAVARLGNGSRITAPDTVPFALWCATRHIDDYAEALWTAVTADGDTDTNAAIVGGVVILANGPQGIPGDWLAAREPL